MREKIILDTGPLVAYLNRNDQYHQWAVDEMGRIEPALLTCEAVLSEACFLLRRYRGASGAVMELLERNLVVPAFRLADEITHVQRLMRKYEDVPMALADACLVRMSELVPDASVMTFDAGFKIYRRNRRQVVPILSPQ